MLKPSEDLKPPIPLRRELLNRPQIWTVSSGKGGVGKTFITSSFGITLAKLGHSVLVLDLDFTGANLHTALGLKPSHLSIRQFFEGEKKISECIIPTQIPHLSYVQGIWDSWSPLAITREQINRIAEEAGQLKYDFIIIDAGPGATAENMVLFQVADEKVLVTTPEPSSIEKSYRFLEYYLCMTLKEGSDDEAYSHLIQSLREYRQRLLNEPFSIREFVKRNEGISQKAFARLTEKPPRLVVNGVRTQNAKTLGHSMRSVCHKFYDLDIHYLGGIDFDNAVWQSAKSREPVLLSQPFTPLAGQFLSMCKHLIDPTDFRAVV